MSGSKTYYLTTCFCRS